MVDLYWYFTDKPFLPFPTVFCSKDWCEDPWHYHGLGEVFGAPRPYDGMLNVPGLVGNHICGTPEEFLQGPAWPPTGEPLVYDADGIPTCCHRLPIFQIATGSRPSAIINSRTYPARVSTGSRPAALIQHTQSFTFLINSGSRLESIVTHTPSLLGSVTTGSRLDSLVEIADCPGLSPSCAASTATMVDKTCGFLQVADLPLWRKWILIPGKNYRFVLDFEDGSGGSWTMWGGDDCTGLSILFSGSEHPLHQEWDFTAAGPVLAWELGIPTTSGMVGTTRVFRLD